MKDLYHKLLRAPNHFALLGVHAGCTAAELKTAHRTLAAMLHPDRNGDRDAVDCMARVNVAYAALAAPQAYQKALLHSGGMVKCAHCAGRGYFAKGKGFSGITVNTACAECAGVGVVSRAAHP